MATIAHQLTTAFRGVRLHFEKRNAEHDGWLGTIPFCATVVCRLHPTCGTMTVEVVQEIKETPRCLRCFPQANKELLRYFNDSSSRAETFSIFLTTSVVSAPERVARSP